MKGRDIWLTIHRWLGLGIGLFFFIASLTGAVLMYEDELDAWLNRNEYRTTPGDIGLANVLETVRQEQPSGKLVRVSWPAPREPTYLVVVQVDDANRNYRIDPGSGDVAQRNHGRNRVVPLIRRTHTTLLAGRLGHEIVTWSSVLALISMAVGLILWWPGVRRFFHGLAVRFRRGFYAFNFDLHQTLGAVTLPLLVVITLSGVLIPFSKVTEGVARVVVGTPAPERQPSPVQVEGATAHDEWLDPVALLRVAVEQVDEGAPNSLRMPREPGDPAVVEFFRGTVRRAAGAVVRVSLDPRNGDVLEVRDPRDQDQARRAAVIGNFNIHVGAYGGELVRIIYVVVCVIGGVLALGGALIWWLKREKQKAVERRRAERVVVRA